MKKVIAAFMAFAMLLQLVSCSKESKYYSWSVPDEKYKHVLELYGGGKCAGTMVVATDEDIVYLYCEDGVEKDGVTRISQNTVFDIGSCSKVFTAVCILQLAEKGMLGINDTLDKYFPEYEAGRNITINNLLHMNSGIPDYLNNPETFWNISGTDEVNQKTSDILQDRITDGDILNAMYKVPLSFEPGSQYEYSNTNYRLLAFIIENVTGMKYCEYVKKNIFDKCGMKNTTSMVTGDLTYVPRDFEENVKYGFSDKDGYPLCPNNSRGDGGIHSNLTDMIAFDRALFTGKLLNQDCMKALLTEEYGYCCGLVKGKDSYSHTGSSISCSAYNKAIESEEFGHIYIIRLER
ncbi:MAG: beta-lactamase family protein [Ruminococcaceae bacterium]|nr:beta-lactamase family protein [Oscillospiraceae bacterium]